MSFPKHVSVQEEKTTTAVERDDGDLGEKGVEDMWRERKKMESMDRSYVYVCFLAAMIVTQCSI